MPKGINKHSRRSQIAAMVCRHSGISAAELASAFGITTQHATDDLRRLLQAGRVSKRSDGRAALWFAPGAAEVKQPTLQPAPVRVPGVDYRYHVPADHRGPFSLAGIGRDVQTGKAWGRA